MGPCLFSSTGLSPLPRPLPVHRQHSQTMSCKFTVPIHIHELMATGGKRPPCGSSSQDKARRRGQS
eukprot:scaffold121402_cov34-Prasinocladus_malaysianus.AAC.1